MPKFPEPPGVSVLKKIPPTINTYTKGSLMWRLHFTGSLYPTPWHEFRYYGPTSSRFDHHCPNANGESQTQNRGIMYLTMNGPACVAEVYQATRIIDRHSRSPWLSAFRFATDIQLLDLTGIFTTTLGASSAIHSGPRPRARRWAQELYDAYPRIDGILYCSSMYGNAPAVALFERGERAIPKLPAFHRALNDPAMSALLTETANNLSYQLV
ncbi:MAG: RES domain-containing protein [Gammaproteobacteria bacterium]|nr:RES domain-containing protein [Gammaproteobacteria bacterium]